MQRELFTGHEKWQEIKYRTEQIKFRPVEEVRPTFSWGLGKGLGYAAAFTQGLTQSTSLGQSLALARSHSESSGWSETDSRTLTHAASVAHMLSESRSRTTSATEGKGQSQAASIHAGRNRNQGHTDASNWQDTMSAASGDSVIASDSLSATRDPMGALLTSTGAHTAGAQHHQNEQTGRALGGGSSKSSSEGEQEGVGLAKSEQRMTTATRGEASGNVEGHTLTVSGSQAQGHSDSRQHSESRGLTETEGRQLTEAIARNFNLSETFQQSANSTLGLSLAPYNQMEEYRETTEHPWSLPEIQHRFTALLKNLRVGEAVVSFSSAEPVKVRVDPPPATPYTPQRTARQIRQFRQAVYAAASAYYLTPTDARREISERQQRVFQRELSGEWFSQPPPALPVPTPSSDEESFG
jgi:hypothetical protein